MIREERYCTACGSTIIQGANDGCFGPRYYVCEVCGETKYKPFPKTFPKRLRVKEKEFATLYLEHSGRFWNLPEDIEAVKLFLCVENSRSDSK